jgi:hypothetical protein
MVSRLDDDMDEFVHAWVLLFIKCHGDNGECTSPQCRTHPFAQLLKDCPAWITKSTLYQHPLVFCAYDGIHPARHCLLGECGACGIHLLIRNCKVMDSEPGLPVTKYSLDTVPWSNSRQWVHVTSHLYGQEVQDELRGNWCKWSQHNCYDKIARAAIQQVKRSLLSDEQYETAVFIGVPLSTHVPRNQTCWAHIICLVGFRRSLLTPGHIGIGVFRWTYDWPDRHRRVHRGLYLLTSRLLPPLYPL